MKKMYIIIFVMLISISSIYSEEMNNRVKGLTTFIADRDNENYLYAFEGQISSNKLFKEYFPQTHYLASLNNIQTMILNNDLWDRTIDFDINNIILKTLDAHTGYVYLNIAELITNQNIDKILIAAKETNIILDSISYPISGINSPSSVKDELNLIYEPIVNLYEANSEFKDMLNNIEINLNNVKEYKGIIDNILQILNKLNDNHLSLIEELNSVKLSSSTLKNSIKRNSDILISQIDKFTYLLEIYNKLDISAFRYYSSTVKTLKISEFLEDVLELNGQNISRLKFNKFRSLALTFTQIEDANSGEEVTQVLSSAILPPVGFRIKRDNSIHFIISSYMGYSITKDLKHGIAGTLNMEVSYGVGQLGSLSLFISPIDFAKPINKYIGGESDDFDYKDLAALSYGVAFGFDSIPLAVGATYEYDDNKIFENSFKFFVGFDVPLITLY